MTRVLIALAALVTVGLLLRPRWQAWRERRVHAAAAAAGLREGILSRRMFASLPPGAPGAVRGVVMDWALGGGLATLIAIDDGTVSLYLNPVRRDDQPLSDLGTAAQALLTGVRRAR